MNSRDPGFYKAPVVKSLLVLTSASSFLHSLSTLRNSYPTIHLVVRVWSFPSVGVWLAASLILYQFRVLERRRGSSSFMSRLLLSGSISMALYGILLNAGVFSDLQLQLIPGAFVYSLVGLLAVEYFSEIIPMQSHLATIPLSSNTALYLFISLLSASSAGSVEPVVLMACGFLGGLFTRGLGISLPLPPSWLTSIFGSVLAKDPLPKLYSGASLSVQAQQRADELEQLMATMYTRQQQRRVRRVVIGRPVRREPSPPSEEQVGQLLSMGFTRQECVQALQHTGNNVAAATQLLTARRT